jgi:holin-like protein
MNMASAFGIDCQLAPDLNGTHRCRARMKPIERYFSAHVSHTVPAPKAEHTLLPERGHRAATAAANNPSGDYQMIKGLTVLLLFQLAGEVLAHLFSLPLPGPVIGMALLFAALALRGAVPAFLGETSNSLLSHLSLLFVPAGVGVMLHFQRIGNEWLAIASALVLSTAVTLAVTALTLRALQRRRQRRDRSSS